MTEVINLAAVREQREATPPTVTAEGEARCISCGHKWHASAPIGVRWLECPACNLPKGLFVHPFAAPEGGYQWKCRCGCDVFYIVPDSVRCLSCGSEQTGY